MWPKVPRLFSLSAGQRITGTVTRLMDFGAFVEIEPGVEGLIHISEMSWGKKIRHPSDVRTPGDTGAGGGCGYCISGRCGGEKSPPPGGRCKSGAPGSLGFFWL